MDVNMREWKFMKMSLNDKLFNEFVINHKNGNSCGRKQSSNVMKLLYKTKK